MQRVLGTMVLLAAILAPSAGRACEKLTSCDVSQYVKFEDVEAFKKALSEFKKVRTRDARAKRSRTAPAPGFASADAAMSKALVGPQFAPPPTTSLMFLLRKDFSDVSLFSRPLETKKADGAEFSLTRDRVSGDTTWAADLLLAVAYNYFVENPRETFIGATIAPYVKLTREIHSKKIDDDVDVKKFGLSGEIGFRNRLVGRGSDYIRGSIAITQDDIQNVTTTHAQAEWLPTYLWLAGTIPGTFINYNFMPEAKAQYDRTTNTAKSLLFSDRAEALRIGPEATLVLHAVPPDGPLYDYLRRVYAKVTYHWWTEAYSGRSNSWLDTSLVYNLTEAGHIGLKLGYRRGRNEDTGAKVDLFKVALTAKACVEVIDKTQC